MNNQLADVSVVIPVYNSGSTLHRAVESIFKQTLKPKEIIVVDDCSADTQTKKILNELNKKPLIRVFYSEKNNGAGSARNIGWDNATGKYIAFLDSDDIWHPQKLEVQYGYMEKSPDIVFSCHHMEVLNKEKQDFLSIDEQPMVTVINPIRYLFKHYPKGGTSFVMICNNLPVRFKEGKRYSEDYLLWLEINFLYPGQGVLLNNVMAYSFKNIYGEAGLSKNLWKMEMGELGTFRHLYYRGFITAPVYYMVKIFSICKYFARKIICIFRCKVT